MQGELTGQGRGEWNTGHACREGWQDRGGVSGILGMHAGRADRTGAG